MIKLIRVIHCLPGAMKRGGIEKVVLQIIDGIDKFGVKMEQDVMVQDYVDPEYLYSLKSNNHNVLISPIKANNFNKYKQFFFNHVKKYDIVHIHAVYSFSYFEAKWAKQLNKKVIFHSHNSNAIIKRKLFHFLFRNKIKKIVDRKVAVSNLAGKWMFGNSDYKVVYNGMNLKFFLFSEQRRQEIRKSYGFKDSDFVVTIVGRLSNQKDPLFSYSLARKMIQKQDNIFFLFLGDGELRIKLEQVMEKDGVSDKVKLLGNKENINDFLCGSDLFMLPSLYEGLSIAMIEAQLSGVPCLISNTVDQDSVINSSVFVLSKKNKNEWEKTITAIEKGTFSREVNLSKFRKFDDRTFIDTILNIYEN